MGLFTPDKVMPAFNSRSEAFDFMVADRLAKGDDYAEAVERADKFADLIAKNKKLPPTPPKQKDAIDTVVGYADKIASVKKDHPEVWELVVGGLGGLISGFLIKQSAEPERCDEPREDLDFETMK